MPRGQKPETEALPTALRNLLIEVRAGLKDRGDDGSQGGHRALVPVKIGWAEVRAVYALHIALRKARADRDKWRVQAIKFGRDDNPAPVLSRAALQNIERVLSGAEDSVSATHAALSQVRVALGRV